MRVADIRGRFGAAGAVAAFFAFSFFFFVYFIYRVLLHVLFSSCNDYRQFSQEYYSKTINNIITFEVD